MGTLLPLFIKFRDFLVTFAPWLLLALACSAGLLEALRWRSGKRDGGPLAFAAAGLAVAMPSLFGTLQFDYRLALVRSALALAGLVAGYAALKGAEDRQAALKEWLGAYWNDTNAVTTNRAVERRDLLAQLRGVWERIWERFDTVALWFGGSCVAAGVLAIYLPYEVGFDLFGRTPWVGVILGAGAGRLIKRGSGMDLPLASLLLLKGAAPSAVAALLLTSNPLPFPTLGGGWRGRWVTASTLALSAVAAALLGPRVL